MSGDEEILPIKSDEKLVTDPVLIHGGRIYKRVDFKREDDLSHYILKNHKLLNRIFGEGSIFLPMEKLIGGRSRAITDALLLKTGRNKFEIWVVEVDMLRHGVNSHIKNQLMKINDALKEVNPWELAERIYLELRRNMFRYQKIREEVLGSRSSRDDLLPIIKNAVDNMSRNVILVIDKINSDLLHALEEIRKAKKNVELIILQRYVDIDSVDGEESEILMITPLKGSEVEKTKINPKSLVKRRMDRYWNRVLKALRKAGAEPRRREYGKTRYYIAYVDDTPILLMRKMRKKGGVELWIDASLIDDDLRKSYGIPDKRVKTGRGAKFKKLLEDKVWSEAYNFTSRDVELSKLTELLTLVITRKKSAGDSSESQEPHQHAH